MKAAARPATEGRAAARAGGGRWRSDRRPTGPEPTEAAAGLRRTRGSAQRGVGDRRACR